MSKMTSSLKKFMHAESSGGIVLGIFALLGFLIANSGFADFYFSGLKTYVLGLTISYWINDGLMAIFFFYIGLEIKKELVDGHLSSPSKAALPMAAAVGGMLVPALFYYFFNPTGEAAAGWGIPMATDIAFALGILSLFGKLVPVSLKVFLLALAIVDDLGAVSVIALFYTETVKGEGLAVAFAALGLAQIIKSIGVKNYFAYIFLGVFVWGGFLYSGVHATIAGVLLGLLTPLHYPVEKGSSEKYSPLNNLLHWLHPWIAFAIMPIFAFANAGVRLVGVEISEVISHPIHFGIVVGLFVGKPIGVVLFSILAIQLKLAKLPDGVNWGQVTAAGCLAGVGFTMSLFISGLAFGADLELYSKMGIIIGSILSGTLGVILLKIFLPKAPIKA